MRTFSALLVGVLCLIGAVLGEDPVTYVLHTISPVRKRTDELTSNKLITDNRAHATHLKYAFIFEIYILGSISAFIIC